jgi:hypothetical protein
MVLSEGSNIDADGKATSFRITDSAGNKQTLLKIVENQFARSFDCSFWTKSLQLVSHLFRH